MSISPGVTRSWVWLDPSGNTQVHASTLLAVAGRTLAAWFAGSREGAPDTTIVLAVREPDAPHWSQPQVLAGTGDTAHWNPVLAHGPDQQVWLFFKRGNTIADWHTWVRTSTDGRNWTGEAELPGRPGGGPVKNQPLLRPDGSWLAPSSVERRGADGTDRWDAVIDIGTDAGRTWAPAPVELDHTLTPGAGIIQPALLPPGPASTDSARPNTDVGEVVALCRSSAGRVYRTSSPDGRAWTRAAPTTLANNNSGLDAARLPSGRIACVHNPSPLNWGPRCPLVLSCSDDDGHTWHTALVLEDGETPMPGPVRPGDVAGVSGRAEYSYPTAILYDDQLLVSYTWQRVGIALVSVPVELIDT